MSMELTEGRQLKMIGFPGGERIEIGVGDVIEIRVSMETGQMSRFLQALLFLFMPTTVPWALVKRKGDQERLFNLATVESVQFCGRPT